MKIAITGGAGFIGSNLAHGLVDECEVHVVDNLSLGERKHIPENAVFVEGSILDGGLLREVFEEAEYVFHQAARPSVPRSIKDPVATHEANATGTLKVLLAARDADVEKVVYAASSSAYGDTETLPKTVAAKPQPKSPYAVSKHVGEAYCRVFDDVYGLPTTSLRYFNVYGPRQDPAGAYAAVIPKFIDSALDNQPLPIHGDGTQTRDFTFVEDVVRANWLAATSPAADGHVVNVGAGAQTSVKELAETIIELTGSSSEILHQPRREGDVDHSLAGLEKTRQLIGYEPEVTLREGLERTVEWYMEQRHRRERVRS